MDEPAREFVTVSGMSANETSIISVVPRLHLFHQWTRWSAPSTIPYRIPRIHATGESIDDLYFTFTKDEQTRTCVVCAAEQVREVKSL